MTKKLLIAGSAIAALLIVAVLGLVFFLDANQFRPKLEALMSDALGRKVTIANITIAPLSGGIALEDLTIADDPAFSRAPFVTAKAVKVGVDLTQLIVSRSLRVESFRLDQPRVVLRRSASGSWNFSSLGPSSPPSGTAAISVFVQGLRIAGGRIVVGGARAGDDRIYDEVNADVTNLSYTSAFPFKVTAKTPGGGTASLEGEAGPFNMKDVAETPFRATVELKQLDVASTGFVSAASGLGGVLDFKGTLTSNGVRMTTKGTASATKVRLLPGSTPARVPVVVDYESSFDSKTRHGVLERGDVHVGKALAHLTGDYTSGETPMLRMKLAGQNMPVTELEAALPAAGVTLPSGASLEEGTLDADLTIGGPADRLVIAGPLHLTAVKLAGFDLGGKLGALASFAGLPKTRDTVIETLGATLRMAPEGIQVDSLNMIVQAIGTLTGAGTIAPRGAMDFKMLAKVKDGAVGGVPGGAGGVGHGVDRVVSFAQTSGVPFRVQGTTSNPVFVPDIGGAARTAVADAVKDPDTVKKAADALSGLFRRKK